MVKLIYLILLVVVLILLLIDLIIRKRSKKLLKSKQKIKLIKLLEKISKIIKFKRTEGYIKTERLLKDISLNFSVEMFYLCKFIIAFITVFIVSVVNYLNQVSIVTKINNLSIYNVKFNADISIVLLAILSSIILPDFILKQVIKLKNVIAQKEVLVLQTYTIMLIKAGKNVKDIIKSLYNRSTMFKKNFEFALNTYSSAPDGALKTLKSSTEIKSFKKIVIALEQCLNSDREVSLIFLKNSRKITKELNRLEKLKKDSNKKIFNTLMLILPLAAWVAVSGYPWFVYVIELINNMPF